MISEPCEKSFRKNIDEIVKMMAPGLVDEHARVRYQAMMALGLTMNTQSPDLQLKYHSELMPMFLKRMDFEDKIKMKAQVVSVTTNFVRGLISDGEEGQELDEEEKEQGKAVIMLYSETLVQAISALFQMSIDKNYAPL